MNKNLIYTRIEDLLNEVGATIDSETSPRKCLSLRILNDGTKLNRILSLLDDQIPMRAEELPSDFFFKNEASCIYNDKSGVDRSKILTQNLYYILR